MPFGWDLPVLLRSDAEYGIRTGSLSAVARAVDLFRAYPRFTDLRSFSTESAYLRSVFLLVIPYAVTGIVLMVVGIGFNVYIITRRGVAPGIIEEDDGTDSDDDAKDFRSETDEDLKSRRSKTARASLVFTALLFASIFALIGMGLVANYGVGAALQGATDVTEAFVADIKLYLQTPLDFLRAGIDKANRVSAGDLKVPLEGESDFIAARDQLREIDDAARDIRRVTDQSIEVGEDIMDNLSLTRFVVNLAVSLLLFAFFLGLGFVFTTNLISDHSHVTRVVLLVLFLLPLGISWFMTGLITTAGVISADFCVSLREFQRDVLASETNVRQQNIFVQRGLQCPFPESSGADLERLLDFASVDFTDSANKPLVAGLKFFYTENDRNRDLLLALNATSDGLEKARDCVAAAKWTARMHFHMCSDFNGSVVASVLLLWLIFIALSVLLLLVFVTSMTGYAVAEFATAYEMLRVHGMPEMIEIVHVPSDIESNTKTLALAGQKSQKSFLVGGGSLVKTTSFFGSATPEQRSCFYGMNRNKSSKKFGSIASSKSMKSSNSKPTQPVPVPSTQGKYYAFDQVEQLPSREQAAFFRASKVPPASANNGTGGTNGGFDYTKVMQYGKDSR